MKPDTSARNSSQDRREWQKWKNLPDMWASQVQENNDRVMAVAKKDGRWRDFTWKEVDREARSVALGLMSLGMRYGDSVAIFSKTRLEWIYSSLGLLMADGVLTCIYHTDSPQQCEHIITNSDTTICFAEEQEQMDKILAIRDHCPTLKTLVVFEKYEPKNIEHVLSYRELTERGQKKLLDQEKLGELQKRMDRPDSSTPFALIYTSGTTGFPSRRMHGRG